MNDTIERERYIPLDQSLECAGCGKEKSYTTFVCCGDCWRRLPAWMKDRFVNDHRHAPSRGPSIWQDRMSLFLSWMKEAAS